jgi:hypothetical protein
VFGSGKLQSQEFARGVAHIGYKDRCAFPLEPHGISSSSDHSRFVCLPPTAPASAVLLQFTPSLIFSIIKVTYDVHRISATQPIHSGNDATANNQAAASDDVNGCGNGYTRSVAQVVLSDGPPRNTTAHTERRAFAVWTVWGQCFRSRHYVECISGNLSTSSYINICPHAAGVLR